MKLEEAESRLEYLEHQLEDELELLERAIASEDPVDDGGQRDVKIRVGKILLEMGSLQMRLLGANRRKQTVSAGAAAISN